MLHRVNGIDLEVAVTGDAAAPAVLLVHGWPHTHRLWDLVAPHLAEHHRVIAPDLRGTGGSTRAADGYDAATLARDLEGVLHALDAPQADVVAIDAGVPPAFLLAMGAPQRVRRLVLIESLLGTLPGAEAFLRGGPPWWFGFHAAPGDLAATVLDGHEAAYLDWFLRVGTHEGRGIPRAIRDAFVAAYSGPASLRAGFGTYRALPKSGAQLVTAVAAGPLTVPTLAIGARPVGDTLHRQLVPIAPDLRGHVIEDCGHIVPLDRPAELLALLDPFLA